MRFIICEKLYDTSKMEYIGKAEKTVRNDWLSSIFGSDVGSIYSCDIYRSKKNNYLLVCNMDCKIGAQAINESEAKRLLMKYDYKNYCRVFGELEEA